MTEPDHDAPTPHQWRHRVKKIHVLSVALWLVLALCVWALVTQGPWASDDDKGRSLADVPDEICSGIVESDHVEEIQLLRLDGKIEQQVSGSLPEGVSCTVGPDERLAPNLRVNVQPLRGPLPDWPLDPVFWSEQTWRVSLGAGLTGMGSSGSAWLVIPCTGGPYGNLLARADILHHGSNGYYDARQFPEIQHPLAVLLAHTAVAVANGAGCRTAALPTPDVVEPLRHRATAAGSDPYCKPAASDDGPIDFSTPVTSVFGRPAPIEGCFFGADSRVPREVFVNFRGILAAYAPPPEQTRAQGRVQAARTAGTCGGEPRVWMAWVDSDDLGPGVVAAHDRLVDDAVKREGCTVEQRFVSPEATAPAPSTPVTPTPSRT